VPGLLQQQNGNRIGDGLLKKLQTVQNSAARVVTGTRKFDHITLALCNLQWLPIDSEYSSSP